MKDGSRRILRRHSLHSSSTTRQRVSIPASVSMVASCWSHRWLTKLAPLVIPEVVWVLRKRPRAGFMTCSAARRAVPLPRPVPVTRADQRSTGRRLPREATVTLPPMAADHMLSAVA